MENTDDDNYDDDDDDDDDTVSTGRCTWLFSPS